MPHRARLGMALAGILLVPGLATLWTAWHKFLIPIPPPPATLTDWGEFTGRESFVCAHAKSLSAQCRQSDRRGFPSARNDVLANVAYHRSRENHRRTPHSVIPGDKSEARQPAEVVQAFLKVPLNTFQRRRRTPAQIPVPID
jgi:hypothetical protein